MLRHGVEDWQRPSRAAHATSTTWSQPWPETLPNRLPAVPPLAAAHRRRGRRVRTRTHTGSSCPCPLRKSLITHGIQAGDVSAKDAIVWALADRAVRMRIEVSPFDDFRVTRQIRGPLLTPSTDHTATCRGRPHLPGAPLRHLARPGAGDRRTALVRQAQQDPQHGVADRGRAFHLGAPLRPLPGVLHRLRPVLGVRVRSAERGRAGGRAR